MIGEIKAYWSKGEHEGSCSNCGRKTEHIGVVKLSTSNEKLRFCPPCLDALVQITEAMENSNQ